MDDDARLDALPYERAFVVQLGSRADDGGGPLVGRAEHLARHRSGRFASVGALFAFNRLHAPSPPIRPHAKPLAYRWQTR